jgi:crotonobetainyl-CoA:carnitine CoA-transferase CaiB-like acyl-CoA transferase
MDDAALRRWWERGRLEAPPGARVTVSGSDPVLASRHRPGEAASAALGLLGAWSARIAEQRGGSPQGVRVDTTSAAASLLGFLFQSAEKLDLTRRQTPLTAFYPTADDRWIHLHGGFLHLADGLTTLLGCDATSEDVGRAVRNWWAEPLEEAVADAGLCAAVARTRTQWLAHPQGAALDGLGAVSIRRIGEAPPRHRHFDDPPLNDPSLGERPLSGIRVADLTRVLAGPTCGRSLAAHGADVLRIGSPKLPSIEPYVVETGRGKRCAFVDLDDADGVRRLRDLVADADIFCQGYRPGSLAARGLGAEELAGLVPGIVYVSINCYGHVGPWAGRPGWEQLAQTASGIAMAESGAETGSRTGTGVATGAPRLLPAAATDYTTGYLAATGALVALSRQIDEGGSWLVEASLCQTAEWIQSGGSDLDSADASGLDDPRLERLTLDTAWGEVSHLPPVEQLERTPARWRRTPSPLGTHDLSWSTPTV